MNAAKSGSFKIGGEHEVNRLGFGAMRIVGPNVWGPPADRERSLQVLARLRDLGVNFIDTADSYGPHYSEELIREALHPYDGFLIATKAGLVRHGPGRWHAVGRPEYLRHACLMSLRRLDVARIDLYQLHRIDRKVPREDQFGELQALQREGLIGHIGLSQVSVEDIEAAQEYFNVATVQNRYNLTDRADEDVLEHCEAKGIGFIPWNPLAAGELADPGGLAAEIADAHQVTAGQVALAWLLARSPVMLPIPGTGSVEHLEENVAAAELELSDREVAELSELES